MLLGVLPFVPIILFCFSRGVRLDGALWLMTSGPKILF